jgi:hypothetical protein
MSILIVAVETKETERPAFAGKMCDDGGYSSRLTQFSYKLSNEPYISPNGVLKRSKSELPAALFLNWCSSSVLAVKPVKQ